MIEIPGYTIIRPLGKGGMAEVYLAIQKSFGREVALKVMHQAQAADEEYSQRFLSEARIVSRLVHPNIVTVYDVGIVDGHHFLSMEYIHGEDLKQAHQKLSLPRRIEVVKDIARALAYAGKKGYVHRDVKPENIMLQGDSGRAVLMDFGIARTADFKRGMTQTGTAIGTPHYMSPEQARGKEVDHRSDLYGLGVVLFWVLAGVVPFDADSAVAVGIKHVSEPIPRLSPQLQIFQPIINRALAKRPEERYQSGDELLRALNEIPLQSLINLDRLLAASQGKLDVEVSDQAVTEINQPALDRVEAPLLERPPLSPAPPDAGHGAHHEVVVHRSGSGGMWVWVVGVLIAAGIGYGVYLQQQLPVEERMAMVSALEDRVNGLIDRVRGGEPAAIVSEPNSPDPLSDQQAVSSVLLEGRVERLVAAAELSAESNHTVADSLPDTLVEPAVEDSDVEAALVNPVSARQLAIDERQQQLALAQELEGQLEAEPQQAIEAAQIYRQLIEKNPTDIEAGQGLQNLRVFVTDRVQTRIQQNDFTGAAEALALAREVLTEGVYESRLRRLQESIEVSESITPLLLQAQEYLDKNYLTSPAETNALGVYEQVLALDADNPQALRGLNTIAMRYAAMGQQHLQEGNWALAKSTAGKGLNIKPDNPQLQDIKRKAEESLQLEQLLLTVNRQIEQGKTLAPPGDNALETLRQVLDREPDHPQAINQIRGIEGGLVSVVEAKIQQGLWQQARAEIARALAYLPDSTEIQSLKAINERAMIEASQPRVVDLLLSHSALNGVAGTQQPLLVVDKTIYVGFGYENFDASGTTLEARLYEGINPIEVDRLYLQLTGDQGLHFFTLENPLQGFASGPYRLELVLQQKTLASTAFEVERPPEPETEIDSDQHMTGSSGILPP